MTKFEILQRISDARIFSELIFDITQDMKSSEQLTEFLIAPLNEKQLQTIRSVAESGNYPLSLDGLQ